MRLLLSLFILSACVPPADNDLLADSDRIEPEALPTRDTSNEIDTAVDDNTGTGGTNEDPTAADSPITLYENSPYNGQTAQFVATIEGNILTVVHGFASSADNVDILTNFQTEQYSTVLEAYYGHIYTEGSVEDTWHEVHYTLDCSNLEPNTYKLNVTGKTLKSDNTVELTILETHSFTVETIE